MEYNLTVWLRKRNFTIRDFKQTWSLQRKQRRKMYADQLSRLFEQFCVIYKRISSTAVEGNCLNFNISFPLYLSRMFIVTVMKNLSVYKFLLADTKHSDVHSYATSVRRSICLTSKKRWAMVEGGDMTLCFH